MESQGLPLLAHLLRRVSDEFVRGCEEWLPTVGIIAPTRTSSTLRLLNERGPLTITQIAEAIRQSYPLVITWVRQLEALNIVESRSDTADKRKRIVSLTETGSRQIALIAEADRMLAQAYRDLFDEARTDLLAPLWTIEHSMRDVPFADRLAKISQEATTAFDRPT